MSISDCNVISVSKAWEAIERQSKEANRLENRENRLGTLMSDISCMYSSLIKTTSRDLVHFKYGQSVEIFRLSRGGEAHK